MKRIVSVSLGSSRRDKRTEATLLGERFLIERIGTDGDLRRYARMFCDLDGQADALGVGGADLYLWMDDRRYIFRTVQRLVSGAVKTPVVDGSGLKNTLERETVRYLVETGVIDRQTKVLMVAAVDRFGMAQALAESCDQVVYGDLVFGIGFPLPIRSYRMLRILARLLLPVITRLPFQWFYPTGSKQESRKPRALKLFAEADLIAGDWHIIRRYMPDDLKGKAVLTNTLRKADIDLLKEAGAEKAIATTPEFEGESFGTNVMEGVLVALLGRRPEDLTPQDYLAALEKLSWKPTVLNLQASSPDFAAARPGGSN